MLDMPCVGNVRHLGRVGEKREKGRGMGVHTQGKAFLSSGLWMKHCIETLLLGTGDLDLDLL